MVLVQQKFAHLNLCVCRSGASAFVKLPVTNKREVPMS